MSQGCRARQKRRSSRQSPEVGNGPAGTGQSLLKILKTELALLIFCESSWLGFLSVRLAILRFRGFWLTEHSNQIGFAAVEFGGAALLGAGGGAGDCGFC